MKNNELQFLWKNQEEVRVLFWQALKKLFQIEKEDQEMVFFQNREMIIYLRYAKQIIIVTTQYGKMRYTQEQHRINSTLISCLVIHLPQYIDCWKEGILKKEEAIFVYFISNPTETILLLEEYPYLPSKK